MSLDIREKLKILANGAKYDVSCSSSGSNRSNHGKGLGNSVYAGICHSFTDDGRCISLLKILYTNYCIYDCAYCINRKSNDIPRAAFSVKEIVDLTINFYRRNYIEGLFLSSGVILNPDHTMEQLANVAKELRTKEKFFGYIHLKAIPGASYEIIKKAGFFADRLSMNIEIPTEQNLKMLAPEKDYRGILQPMQLMKEGIIESKEERRKYRTSKAFVPAGQSTQFIVGASPEKDQLILKVASGLYNQQKLKRVYYSGFLPVNEYDKRLPAIKEPPLIREHRLYQADWLMRFYKFDVNEIVDDLHPDLDLEIDPKLSWALRNPWLFPIDVNHADYEMILRIPGIGVRSAQMIINARRYGKLSVDKLKKIGVVMKRAKYFITCSELPPAVKDLKPEAIRTKILTEALVPVKKIQKPVQLQLYFG
ncbi:MAG: putative DNA modification/repair radical SAM protein [Bacteroidia bacterium]|nr:putative DNA modification/repair radical SAM protein [Bacteroidia bacterium]